MSGVSKPVADLMAHTHNHPSFLCAPFAHARLPLAISGPNLIRGAEVLDFNPEARALRWQGGVDEGSQRRPLGAVESLEKTSYISLA